MAKGSGAHHILGCRGTEGVEAVKLLSVPNTDASAIGAIEATEVKCTFYNLEIIKWSIFYALFGETSIELKD